MAHRLLPVGSKLKRIRRLSVTASMAGRPGCGLPAASPQLSIRAETPRR